MLLYYVRHGDPIYSPSTLTPLGRRQAEAVSRRLALHGIDKIYVSPSGRAMETAQPTAELMKREIVPLNFADEALAWKHFAVKGASGQVKWIKFLPEFQQLFCSDEIYRLGEQWYEHSALQAYGFGDVLADYRDKLDAFFLSLGYEHDRAGRLYRAVQASNERVALFAHGGFGDVFLSTVLHIPYPLWTMHFSMTHTGVTVIDFRDRGGVCIPQILQYSCDAHLYAERLPTAHCNEVYI